MKHNLKELLLHYSLQDYEILYYYFHFISGVKQPKQMKL